MRNSWYMITTLRGVSLLCCMVCNIILFFCIFKLIFMFNSFWCLDVVVASWFWFKGKVACMFGMLNQLKFCLWISFISLSRLWKYLMDNIRFEVWNIVSDCKYVLKPKRSLLPLQRDKLIYGPEPCMVVLINFYMICSKCYNIFLQIENLGNT